MSKIIVLCLFSFILSGCTSYPIKYTPHHPDEKIEIKNYELNKNNTVFIGDALISRKTIDNERLRQFIFVDTYSPQNTFSLKFGHGKADFHKGYKYYSTYSRDTEKLLTIKIERYKNVENPFFVYLPLSADGGIVGDYLLYSRYSPYSSSFFNTLSTLKEHRSFKINSIFKKYKFDYVGKTVKSLNEDGVVSYFKQELIYTGKFNNIVKLLYREYNTNQIKSAFTYEILYDTDKSNIIRYKEFKIEIINSDNEKIAYKVLSDK